MAFVYSSRHQTALQPALSPSTSLPLFITLVAHKSLWPWHRPVTMATGHATLALTHLLTLFLCLVLIKNLEVTGDTSLVERSAAPAIYCVWYVCLSVRLSADVRSVVCNLTEELNSKGKPFHPNYPHNPDVATVLWGGGGGHSLTEVLQAASDCVSHKQRIRFTLGRGPGLDHRAITAVPGGVGGKGDVLLPGVTTATVSVSGTASVEVRVRLDNEEAASSNIALAQSVHTTLLGDRLFHSLPLL
ncbi:hypothetical protein J6590_083373 [Homalodisca vitripennis]|nr:hypothetical protein J6590_083373 [Homalodisca vitripennis]